MTSNLKRILKDGIKDNNVIFVQSLALCPTMAVTVSATNGLGMGLATTVVLAASNVVVSSLRNVISQEVRIPVFIMLIAALVTLMDMAINAWLHELYKVLGLFIALIVANCAVLGRAEVCASREPPLVALADGLAIGLGFTAALTAIGAVREIVGSGTLFSQASLLLGEGFSFLELTLIPNYGGVLLMILPPGGFMVLGFMLAGKRVLAERSARRAAVAPLAASSS